MESLTSKPGIREQYRPICDIGRTEIPQRSGLLPHPSALSFRLEAWWPFSPMATLSAAGLPTLTGSRFSNRAKNLVVSA